MRTIGHIQIKPTKRPTQDAYRKSAASQIAIEQPHIMHPLEGVRAAQTFKHLEAVETDPLPATLRMKRLSSRSILCVFADQESI
ncbi:hypothetical protein BA011_40580 (plasmid) [Rhizobium leguminosarum]|uniref:Uncharacterized protein n=1 Tax=Rhizobium leguminosarum TaxID=384 RepID=A0A1B1CKB6_RHILE|nr:hypothetical protein BA011_40580 [Rhizobium leguminosarum]